jgi:hypothetical protein
MTVLHVRANRHPIGNETTEDVGRQTQVWVRHTPRDRNGFHEITPERSLTVQPRSPVGFSWGDHGTGTAQLALALMLEVFDGRDDAAEWARVYHEWLIEDVLARLDENAEEVEFTVNMDRWVYDRNAKGAVKITKGGRS